MSSEFQYRRLSSLHPLFFCVSWWIFTRLIYFLFTVSKGVPVIATLNNVIYFFGWPSVAFAVSAVINTPEPAGLRLKVETYCITKSTGENYTFPCEGIYLQNGGHFIVIFLAIITFGCHRNIQLTVRSKLNCPIRMRPATRQVIDQRLHCGQFTIRIDSVTTQF